MATVAYAGSFKMRELKCGSCGIVFWAPEFFMQEKQENGKDWYCPNGHSRVYRESDATKLRKQLDAERQRTAMERQMRLDEEARRAKIERKLKRVERGVCPECNRSFVNLKRHMDCKHKSVA